MSMGQTLVPISIRQKQNDERWQQHRYNFAAAKANSKMKWWPVVIGNVLMVVGGVIAIVDELIQARLKRSRFDSWR